MSDFVSLYDAKTGLAKLVPAPRRGKPRRSARALGLKEVPADFDDSLPAEIEAEFYDRR